MAVDGTAPLDPKPDHDKVDHSIPECIKAGAVDETPKLTSSTYNQHFVHKSVPKRQLMKKPCELKLPSGKMEICSKYAEDFKAHCGHKRLSSFKPTDEIELPTGSMQAFTTSQDAFCAKQLSPRFQRQPEIYKKPEIKMDCRTSYSSDFLKISECCKLPPIKPQDRKESAKAFQDSTENREQFKVPSRKDGGGKQASCKPRNDYIPPIERFIAMSSYENDFKLKLSDRPKMIKPQGYLSNSLEYFCGCAEPPPSWKHSQPLNPIGTVNVRPTDLPAEEPIHTDVANHVNGKSDPIESVAL